MAAVTLGESQWLYPSQRAPNALGPLLLGILAHCKQIEKDFYRYREVAKHNKALIA